MGASGLWSGSEVRSSFGQLVVMIWRMTRGKAGCRRQLAQEVVGG